MLHEDGAYPRFSGLLRSFCTDPSILMDLQAEIAARPKAIAKRRTSKEKSTRIGWDAFVLSVDNRERGENAKKDYRDFLKLVQEMVGAECSSEVLRSSAQIVFEILTDASLTPAQQRAKLVDNLGHVAPDLIKNAIPLAQSLLSLRNSIHVSATEGAQRSKEFGHDIVVNLEGGLDRWDEEDAGLALYDSDDDDMYEFVGNGEDDQNSSRLEWLEAQCLSLSQNNGRDMMQRVIAALNGSTSAVEEQLFAIFGAEGFELMSQVIQFKDAIVTEALEAANKPKPKPKPVKHTASLSRCRPTIGAQVTINTESEKMQAKLERKEAKRKQQQKMKRQESSESNLSQDEWLATVGFDPENMRAQRDKQLLQGPKNVQYSGMSLIGEPLLDSEVGLQQALPAGTTQVQHKGYEEWTVPPAKGSGNVDESDLVSITELDPFDQLAFEGTKRLNRIQSAVFHAAYKTSENLLICAPTGAGKTNIAMLAILHEIKQHIKGGVLHKQHLKIIYVAPMKALAAEVVDKFSKRLSKLGLAVQELTGDMQMTKREMEETQVIVTTPEKWDVITRKSSDAALANQVKLLIIDEVHLLNDERGAVIEAIVARTLRQVEQTQSAIRIVGLSATLPNYKDVAIFLRVNPQSGLFFFGPSYRPVPLTQQFIGVTETNPGKRNHVMNEITFQRLLTRVQKGHQVMVFVHSRKDTGKSAKTFVEFAQKDNLLRDTFSPEMHSGYGMAVKQVEKSKNKELKELFQHGFGIHHAGMLRSDRTLVERLFEEGLVKVLCCTATLAWGVNLPAHTVLIKGTQIYDAKHGKFVELSVLDVMQIFGRAGRPQYDKSGEGIIITTKDKLQHYLRLTNSALPIESQLSSRLPDMLNAEVVLGSVTNVREGVAWLSYTYLFIRMLRNPMVYGIPLHQLQEDPLLGNRRHEMIQAAARDLAKAKMVRFDERSGILNVTDLGRVASHYYISHSTVEVFNELVRSTLNEAEWLNVVCNSNEFENILPREEEMEELEKLQTEVAPLHVGAPPSEKSSKVNILLQSYVSHAPIQGFALVADCNYIVQSAGRILRALFEIVLRRGWVSSAERVLTLAKVVDRRVWPFQSPLRQFCPLLPEDVVVKLEANGLDLDRLWDMQPAEIGRYLHSPNMGQLVAKCVKRMPYLSIFATVKPITRTILKIQVELQVEFEWHDKTHGSVEPWWLWVEDAANEHIYHSEYVLINKKQAAEPVVLSFTIPIFEPIPSQYFIRVISDRWLGAECTYTVSFEQLHLPDRDPPRTPLLRLTPLPIQCLGKPEFESLFRFTHFNPIQTQCFHTLYHTDNNVLLGAPTGSGKTNCAELAMMRLFRTDPTAKVVYIGPLKALVRERYNDWSKRLTHIGKKTVELTGDLTPDVRSLMAAHVVITTPEKWDGISRSWQHRKYVKSVGLVVIDEIHLLGEERGPVLEVIVSRMRYIASQTERKIRIIGLSTAMANAKDVADWLGIDDVGLFNFHPSVRPVPLEVHITGFEGKHYCPRMATMNKPAYSAIAVHSPTSPVLVFVSSRRQTRLTALDLIAFCAADDRHQQWLHMPHRELADAVGKIKDVNLAHCLNFGIGLHHAGLCDTDKAIVEDLFATVKIQVLISTSTLAWGVNLPAHLVIIKGTEYYDAKTKRYVDFPITDVLQMMGRAGRPQFDTLGKACIFVHEPKKSFYRRFLYEPFPIESALPEVLHEHINAEIVAGTIGNKQDAIDYLTWTFFFRRLLVNPSFYQLTDTSAESISAYLHSLLERTLYDLADAGCIDINKEDGWNVESTALGQIASYYYLHHSSIGRMANSLARNNTLPELLQLLCSVHEYDELPVRHNEEILNAELAQKCRYAVNARMMDSPQVKAQILLQAHFGRLSLPISDYVTDLKSVLDQAVRILQAMIDCAADSGFLFTTLKVMSLVQMVYQGRWHDDPSMMTLPHVSHATLSELEQLDALSIPEALQIPSTTLRDALAVSMEKQHSEDVIRILHQLPILDLTCDLQCSSDNGGVNGQLKVALGRANRQKTKKAHVPRYPKPKDEGWWILLGIQELDELLALKRVTFGDQLTTQLSFEIDSRIVSTAASPLTLTLYCISDCYIGVDQQQDVHVNISSQQQQQQQNK